METFNKIDMQRFVSIIIIFFILNGCHSIPEKSPKNCVSYTDIPAVLDMKAYGEGRWSRLLIAAQNTTRTDPSDEWMEQGSIYFKYLEDLSENSLHKFSIAGRDELPFHPMKLSAFRKGKHEYMVVLNRPIKGLYVIEYFEMKAASLTFTNRIRNSKFGYIKDIYVDENDRLILLSDLRFRDAAKFERYTDDTLNYEIEGQWSQLQLPGNYNQIVTVDNKSQLKLLSRVSDEITTLSPSGNLYSIIDRIEVNGIYFSIASGNKLYYIAYPDGRKEFPVSKKKRGRVIIGYTGEGSKTSKIYNSLSSGSGYVNAFYGNLEKEILVYGNVNAGGLYQCEFRN